MRIIAGEAGGVRLEVGPDTTARPFLEIARGALFNSLGAKVPGAGVLDLYAGSGALGLEALSRGAASCVFVERDRNAAKWLAKNIAGCRMGDRSRVVRSDVLAALASLSSGGGRYDLVFVDPPFPDLPEWRPGGGAEGIMRASARLLAADGVLVFRLEERKAAAPDWPDLFLAKDRRYGRSRVCQYRPVVALTDDEAGDGV